jgi:uncharacterized membrane protein
MTIAFMPFPTAVLSEYGGSRGSISFYVISLIFAGFLNRAVLLAALRNLALRVDNDEKVSREAQIRTSWTPKMIGIAALGAAMIRPEYAFIPLLGTPLILKLVGVFARRRASRGQGCGIAADRCLQKGCKSGAGAIGGAA